MKAPRPLRERKKKATTRALLASAHRLFREKGFEATTIDEICDEVDVSRRTFFRYFPNKEALVFPHRTERLERFFGLMMTAPRNENPLETLRRTAAVFAREYMEHREQLVAQQRLIHTSPALLAREREIDRDWEAAMARAFRERIGPGPASDLRARVFAGAAIGTIRATMRHWFALDGQDDLARLGKEALDCLERGFGIDPSPSSPGRQNRKSRPGPEREAPISGRAAPGAAPRPG